MTALSRLMARPPARTTRRAALILLVLTVGVLLAPAPARADEFIDRVNAAFARIPDAKRSDLVILPLLAKMTDPPAQVGTPMQSMLLNSQRAAWPAAAEWAQAEPQKALIKALSDVTNEEDYRVAMVFAQGYGVDAVADHPELIKAKLYTELGDPPTLTGAEHGYLPAFGKLQLLANVEATRLADSGDPGAALEVLFDWLYFSRQIADRPFLKEKAWAINSIKLTLQRIRDICYEDSRAQKHALTAKIMHDLTVRLFDDKKGYLGLDRIRLPEGDFEGAQQLLTRVMVAKGGTNAEAFGLVLARIGASERPLRLLSESAYWDQIRPSHAGWYESMDMLVGKDGNGGIIADWRNRWDLSPFDPVVKKSSDYQRHVAGGPKFAVLRMSLGGVEALFPMRLAARAEAAGARMSLAVYGFTLQNGGFPPSLTSVRPYFVDAIDKDPYSGAKRAIEYFVPVRDTPKGDRGEVVPYEIHVYPGAPYPNFAVKVRDDVFVVYSVGPDDNRVMSKDATQDDPKLEGDYLFWPPVVSLLRKHLLQNHLLK